MDGCRLLLEIYDLTEQSPGKPASAWTCFDLDHRHLGCPLQPTRSVHGVSLLLLLLPKKKPKTPQSHVLIHLSILQWDTYREKIHLWDFMGFHRLVKIQDTHLHKILSFA